MRSRALGSIGLGARGEGRECEPIIVCHIIDEQHCTCQSGVQQQQQSAEGRNR